MNHPSVTFRLLLLTMLCGWAAVTQAQTPSVTQGVPAESPLGEQFCFDTRFENTGAPGFGPYFRLELPPELSLASASLFSFDTGQLVTDLGVFAPAPGNSIEDPNVELPVVGTPGNRLLLFTLPIGAVLENGPDLTVETCLDIDPTATAGIPLPIQITPIYRLGDTPTGDNGPIFASPVLQEVVPVVLFLSKSSSAPEQERTPGPGWPYEYILTADIANGATVSPLTITDTLPPQFQYDGSLTITGGGSCTALEPSLLTPGGNLLVECTGVPTGTPADNDVTVRYGGFVTDVLDGGSCAAEPVNNIASAAGDYQIPGGGTSPAVTPPAEVTVTAKHVAAQKSVTPEAAGPNDTISYTTVFQVTDFSAVDSLVAVETLPDGVQFVSHDGLQVNGAAVAITPTVVVAADSTTVVTYDISAATGSLPAGTAITLSYSAQVQERYNDTGLPVLAGDSLSSPVALDYALPGGASGCSETSSATVSVQPVQVTKELINPQPIYRPGDPVTFRLTKRVPSGSASAINFVDFFPLPVLEVADLDLNTDIDNAPGSVRRGPADTAGLNLAAGAITVNPTLNALLIAWPDLDSNQPQVIQVDVTGTVTDAPFSDGLFLTNVFVASNSNTAAEVSVNVDVDALNIGAPELNVTKGVAATDGQGTIVPGAGTLPVDGDLSGADGNDLVDFLITIENTGNAQAHDVLITDPGVPGLLSGCNAVAAENGLGAPLGFSGAIATGITLDDPLGFTDGTPGAPYGADTALVTVRCQVAATVPPSSSFDNTVEVSWAALPGAPRFEPVSDDASVSTRGTGIEKLFVFTSEAGTRDDLTPPRVTIGEIARYRLVIQVPEGQIVDLDVLDRLPDSLQFLDDGTARAAFVSNGGLATTGPAIPNITGSAADLATVPSASLTFPLPALNNTNDGAPFGNGDDPRFELGTVTNGDSDSDNEFIVIELNALAVNVNANNRDNRFAIFSGSSNLNGNSNRVRVRQVEPQLTVDKTASISEGDAGDTATYEIVLRNGTGNNVSPAWEASLTDTLPADVTMTTAPASITPVLDASCGTPVISNNSTATEVAFDFSVLPPGCEVSIAFEVTLDSTVTSGGIIENTATATWTSLPGTNGTVGGSNLTGSSAPGDPGAIDGERNDSGGVNDYTDDGVARINVPGVGIVKRLTATDQPESLGSDLLIGEQATFQIEVTVPEGITTTLNVTDSLPFSNGLMRLDDVRVTRIGNSLVDGNGDPLGTIPPTITRQDLQFSDGLDDTAEVSFGALRNLADNVSDIEDRVLLEIDATLVDRDPNANGDVLINTATVAFGSGLSALASAAVTVREAVLEIEKNGSTAQGDAGDLVTYTVTVSHAGESTADAFDLALEDVLIPELELDLGSVQLLSGPAFNLPQGSSGNTVALEWDTLPLGESIVLEYQVTLADTVQPGQALPNLAALSWNSTAEDSNDDERSYAIDDGFQVTVTPPGISKLVVATSEPGTGSGVFGPADDLTIGETVTYRFTVIVPEGTSFNSLVTDQLPTGSSTLELIRSELVSAGTLMNLALPVGAPGTVSDSNGDGINDRVSWSLGNVFNAPDGVSNDDDLLVFDVQAVVRDLPINQSNVREQLNTATASSDTASGFATAPIDIVAPELALDKQVTDPSGGFVDAGDVVSVRLTVEHTTDSTADSYSNLLEDTLPPGLNWIDDGTVSSNCPGLAIDSSAEPLIVFSFPELTVTDAICTVDYQVQVDDAVQPGQQLENMAMLVYDSTPVFVEDRTRQRTTTAVADVVVLAPTLVKLAVNTSEADTTIDQGDPALLDLAIGETVTYELTLVLPEGITPNVVLTDLLPAGANGVIEAVGARISALGSQLSLGAPGTPVFRDDRLADGLNDTVELTFGDITNIPDQQNTAADRLVVEIVGRVVDVPANVDGQVLRNLAFVTSDAGDLQDSADVEVVEPALLLDKSMSLREDGLVRITLALENQGTAPAYDLEVNDVLSETDWLVGSLVEVSVANGFTLDVLPATPAAGSQTVRFATAAGATSPAGTIPVGSSVSATFDVPLAVLPPNPNPLPNEATLDAGDTLPGDNPAARELPGLTAQDAIALPQLELLKSAALQADNDGSGTVSAGDTLRYTLQLTNIGEAPATNLVIDDAPDTNSALVNGSVSSDAGTVVTGNGAGDAVIQLALPTLAAGAVNTLVYDTTINSPLPAGVEQVVNQAVVDSDELPPRLSDDPTDPAGDQDPTIVPIEAQPDLTLTKDDGGATAAPGQPIVWTLAFANVGTQDATGVIITDTVPENSVFLPASSDPGFTCLPGNQAGGICTLLLGDLAAGDSGTVAFAVTVNDTVPAGVELISNSAQIADDGSNGDDPTPDDNLATDDTPLDATPDLVISKDDGGAGAVPGELLSWTLQLNNVGAQGATGVLVRETVPDDSTFDAAASTAGWSCADGAPAGTSCVLDIGALDAGASRLLQFTVRVDAPLPAGVRFIENAVQTEDDGANGADPTPDDNRDEDSAPVGNFVDLAITKSAGLAIVQPDQVLVYALTYENLGAQGVTGASITETVPANTRFDQAGSSSGWSCADGAAPGTVCTFSLGGLAGGAGGTVNFAVRLDAILPEAVTEILNSVAIGDDGSNGPDIEPSNNRDDEVTPADVRVSLDLVKSLSSAPDPIVLGDVLEYTLVATNTGTSSLSNVIVGDSLITPTGGSTPCALLAPLETCTLVGTYQVEQEDFDRGRIDNTGTALSDQTELLEDLLTVPLDQSPALALTKQATLDDTNGNDLGNFNERVDYSLVAVNTGNVTLSAVQISDPLLPTLSCTPAQPAVLAPGDALSCTGSFTITGRELSRAELVNTARVDGLDPADRPLSDVDSATVPLAQRPTIAVSVMSPPALALLVLLMLLLAWRAQHHLTLRR